MVNNQVTISRTTQASISLGSSCVNYQVTFEVQAKKPYSIMSLPQALPTPSSVLQIGLHHCTLLSPRQTWHSSKQEWTMVLLFAQ